MKQTIYILTFLILTCCGQSNSNEKNTIVSDTTSVDNKIKVQNNPSEEEQSKDDFRKQSLNSFEKATLFKLTDTITADFNGDGFLDKAVYKKEGETSGIAIIHGQTNKEIRIGFGKPFAHMKNVNWVDYWGLVEDRVTSETTFTDDGDVFGSKEVKLQNPSIALGADEIGGGLITFIDGKYVWIHQTC